MATTEPVHILEDEAQLTQITLRVKRAHQRMHCFFPSKLWIDRRKVASIVAAEATGAGGKDGRRIDMANAQIV